MTYMADIEKKIKNKERQGIDTILVDEFTGKRISIKQVRFKMAWH